VLEELGGRGHEVLVQFGLGDGDRGELGVGGGCGVTDAGANDIVFGIVRDFAPRECGSLLCVGHHGNRRWKRQTQKR